MAKKVDLKKSNKPFHIAYYVINCTPGMRMFSTLKDMKTFFKEFEERYPKGSDDNGTFVDFYVTNISGEVKFL